MLTSETLSNLSWMLDKGITYLNHGSFGARPKEVFEAQIALKKEFERSPIQFLDREGKERVEHARIIISQFLGCSEKNLGFIENATTGVGCVIQSLKLPVGSELVATNHVYNGVRQLLKAASDRNDWTYREIEVRTPIHSPKQIVDTVIDGFSDKTKGLWNTTKIGEIVGFYVTQPFSKIIGFGQITKKLIDESLLWDDELNFNRSLWKYRVEFMPIFIKRDWEKGIRLNSNKKWFLQSTRVVIKKNLFFELVENADKSWRTKIKEKIQ